MYMYFKIGTDGAQNLINYFFQILAVRSSMGNYQDQTKISKWSTQDFSIY